MAKEQEKEDVYFVVYHWMISRLGLKGAALLVYALIYGYTKAVGEFSGSLAYVEERTGLSRKGVINCLRDLVEKELLIKTEIFQNGLKFVKYRAAEGSVKSTPGWCTEYTGGGVESTPGWCTEYTGGGVESTPNNKDKNKDKNKVDIKGEHPSEADVTAYCAEKGYDVDPQHFYSYYTDRGWRRKSGKPITEWQAVVDDWQRSGYDKKPVQTSAPARAVQNISNSSFDVDEFFEAALKRSYEDGG